MSEPATDRTAYYREAATWSQDRQAALRRSRRIAWIVAATLAVIALFEALAIMLMMPLKTVEPYTLLVDRQTGFVQAVKPLEPARIDGDTALTQSFLVQYVVARESFDINALQPTFRKVALWSADSARSRYIAGMQASNPDSPLQLFPRSTIVETIVKSVTPMGPETAMVRFDRRRIDVGGAAMPLGSFVAVMRFRFSGEPMRAEDRFLNPLGFQVTQYQRSPEVLPPPPGPAERSSPATQAQPVPVNPGQAMTQ
ncbi:VirB8/TrbF family protein [Sphingomonas sp. BGYR3]|uniref:virB8 family protein n=1 Tax=Sphingomonas sp. BGYR3 TaxID=2975483 RepID=UPI0021A6CE9D|nr:VirB8/TrbF family protein [Sphingomonas sp. BGYR3]MDG5488835.1 VirB8/TrbF family protein [Sphingomonas sp. BGYR3]